MIGPASTNMSTSWLTVGADPKRLQMTLLVLVTSSFAACRWLTSHNTNSCSTSSTIRRALAGAIAIVAAFAAVSYWFVCTPFSFGYFLGFYFYTMVMGYLWLNHSRI